MTEMTRKIGYSLWFLWRSDNLFPWDVLSLISHSYHGIDGHYELPALSWPLKTYTFDPCILQNKNINNPRYSHLPSGGFIIIC
jgi:hypothetical protein